MDMNELKIEIFDRDFGWIKIPAEDLVEGVLFRMFSKNDVPIFYEGKDRWIFVETRFVATTGETVLNIRPYITLVEPNKI